MEKIKRKSKSKSKSKSESWKKMSTRRQARTLRRSIRRVRRRSRSRSRSRKRSIRRSIRRVRRRSRSRSRSRRRSIRRVRRRSRSRSRSRKRSIRRSIRRVRRRSRSRSRSRRSVSVCKRGEILKVGYTTKKGVRVSPTCIKDRGAKGKGPKVIPSLKKGSMMGYSTYLPEKTRHKMLRDLVKKYDYSTVIKKLNAVRTLSKRTNPMASNIIGSDIYYLQNKYRRD